VLQIAESAHRHGVEAEDIEHAWTHAVRLVEYEYDGEERLLVIGPNRAGLLLELVAIPVDAPAKIIHAAGLRAKFHRFLS
jgi:uncharacterized DUF497 family protein